MKNPCRDIMVGLMFVMAAIAPPTRDIARAGDDPATYPTRAIHVVVGFTPGGGNDLIARIVGRKLSENLGQPVIIDNKPGAGAIVATEYVAKAPPDGYTLLVGASGAMAINPAAYAKLPYDPVRDFIPVSELGSFPLILVVNAASPIKSVGELIAFAKTNPDKANYSSSSAAFQKKHRRCMPCGPGFPRWAALIPRATTNRPKPSSNSVTIVLSMRTMPKKRQSCSRRL